MFLSCIDISKIVLIVYTSLMILHRTKIESLIIPTQQQMNKTFNPLSHREANTEILSVSEQGNKWKDTLLICGAPRGRTAPLPRILQRCCNPWSRDQTHTRTHAGARSALLYETRVNNARSDWSHFNITACLCWWLLLNDLYKVWLASLFVLVSLFRHGLSEEGGRCVHCSLQSVRRKSEGF